LGGDDEAVALKRTAAVVTMVLSAACAATPPQSGVRTAVPTVPATPRKIHAEIRDTSVDALPDYRVPVAPDIVLAIVDVDADAVVFRFRHRPGSFDPATTRFAIDLDTDQNAATGSEGIEYNVFVFPAGGKGADVARTTAAGYTVVGTVPVSFVADGCDVAIPCRCWDLTMATSTSGFGSLRNRHCPSLSTCCRISVLCESNDLARHAGNDGVETRGQVHHHVGAVRDSVADEAIEEHCACDERPGVAPSSPCRRCSAVRP
jgi:hypothetical protein